MKLRVSHGNGAETSDGRYQRFLFRGENALRTWVDEDRSLYTRGAKRGSNQHSRRNQIPQGVHFGADGKGQGLAGSHGALRQIGCEA